MSLIDSTYFVDEILIAGLENTVDSTGSKLSSFITKYEARFLKELLGKDLYNAFITGLEEDPIQQKWLDLKNELVNDTTKESPIANYVYYYYSRNKATETVGFGEIQPNTENGIMANAVQKQTRAWNEMVDWNKQVIDFINDNISDYPEFKPSDTFFCGKYYGCYSTREILCYKNSLGI
jgi:hypothetical protein